MPVYIYADETEFEVKENVSVIGTGIFITKSPVDHSLIINALSNLRADDDKIEQDKQTLDGEYFHASEDSKNAHSHLCREIVGSLKGNFLYSYFSPSLSEGESRTLNPLMKLTLSLSTVGALNTTDKIYFVIEQRDNFKIHHAEIWKSDLYKTMERVIYNYPLIPTLFPEIIIEIGDKKSPGLQVTDFILWSLNRSKMERPDNTWLNRLNLDLVHKYKEQEGPLSGGLYVLGGEEVRFPPISYPDFKAEDIDPNSNHELFNLYILIEDYLRNLLTSTLPTHVNYLRGELEQVVNQLKINIPFSNELIKKACSLFLRLFDTFPIYNGLHHDEEERWLKLLSSRKIAALCLREDFHNGVCTCDFIVKARRNAISQFGIDNWYNLTN